MSENALSRAIQSPDDLRGLTDTEIFAAIDALRGDLQDALTVPHILIDAGDTVRYHGLVWTVRSVSLRPIDLDADDGDPISCAELRLTRQEAQGGTTITWADACAVRPAESEVDQHD